MSAVPVQAPSGSPPTGSDTRPAPPAPVWGGIVTRRRGGFYHSTKMNAIALTETDVIAHARLAFHDERWSVIQRSASGGFVVSVRGMEFDVTLLGRAPNGSAIIHYEELDDPW